MRQERTYTNKRVKGKELRKNTANHSQSQLHSTYTNESESSDRPFAYGAVQQLPALNDSSGNIKLPYRIRDIMASTSDRIN